MFCESRLRNIWKKQKYTVGSRPQGDVVWRSYLFHLIGIFRTMDRITKLCPNLKRVKILSEDLALREFERFKGIEEV